MFPPVPLQLAGQSSLAVPVREDDNPETLAARVQAAERRIYPRAIELYARGLLKRESNRVRVRER